ncbi:hypothetical protein BD779DRAFT_1668188 [Infundibulicybe gibba]|nr:hypothetical protein BD779DRAFT_1668188 [Infundibulicybe gibba]
MSITSLSAPPDYESRFDASSESHASYRPPLPDYIPTSPGRGHRNIPSSPPYRSLRAAISRRSISASSSVYYAHSSQTTITKPVSESNYVALSRTLRPRLFGASLFKGTFALNPYLHIPTTLLSPLPPGETEADRKNLKIEVDGGGINVNITLLGDPDEDEQAPKRTRVLLKLVRQKGIKNTHSLIARLDSPSPNRPPLRLSARAVDGYLSVHLPGDYRGPLTIHVAAGDLDNHVSFSHGVDENTRILSETPTSRSYFVGELGGWAKTDQNWGGDRAILIVDNGMVRVQVAGEPGGDGLKRFMWGVGMLVQPPVPRVTGESQVSDTAVMKEVQPTRRGGRTATTRRAGAMSESVIASWTHGVE